MRLLQLLHNPYATPMQHLYNSPAIPIPPTLLLCNSYNSYATPIQPPHKSYTTSFQPVQLLCNTCTTPIHLLCNSSASHTPTSYNSYLLQLLGDSYKPPTQVLHNSSTTPIQLLNFWTTRFPTPTPMHPCTASRQLQCSSYTNPD